MSCVSVTQHGTSVAFAQRNNFFSDLTLCFHPLVAHIVANGNPGEYGKIGDEMMAVINVSEQTSIDKDLLDKRPLRYQSESTTNSTRVSDEDKRIHCSQVVFSILDYLQRWLRERRLIRDEKFHSIKCEHGRYKF